MATTNQTTMNVGKLGDPYTNLPEIYQTQSFDEQAYKDQLLTKKYGEEASRRDKRRFNRYMKSDAGLQAQQDAKTAFDQEEHSKWSQSYKDYASAIDAQHKARVQAATTSLRDDIAKLDMSAGNPTLISKTAGRSNDEWNKIANRFGFANMDEVAAWQAENGLEADGKFGNNSRAKWHELERARQAQEQAGAGTSTTEQEGPGFWKTTAEELPIYGTFKSGQRLFRDPSWSNAGDFAGDLVSDALTLMGVGAGYKLLKGARAAQKVGKAAKATRVLTPDVITKPIKAYPGVTPGVTKPTTIMAEVVRPTTATKAIAAPAATKAIAAPVATSATSAVTPAATRAIAAPAATQAISAPAATRAIAAPPKYPMLPEPPAGYQFTLFKQGGNINKVNYFQQGGAAPQQDIQQQVVALVQAAMQGDQKATETVNKIMEAAKAGDQQALQLAQLIQQVAQQMQGQAPSAKLGSKLRYIESLKYAKGGKTCPACEKSKQIEMKACGGKKAKKRYFGGLV